MRTKPYNLTTEQTKLVEDNQGLVFYMLKKQWGVHPNDTEDLEQVGRMALLRAAEKFDATKGFKFSTYACLAIGRAIQRERELTRRLGRNFGYVTLRDADDRQMIDGTAAEPIPDRLQLTEDVERLRVALVGLSDRDRDILCRRFGLDGEPETLDQIGRSVGLTKERIRQIEVKSLRKLRSFLS